jgi:dihydroxy-acid dehydratase
LILNVSEEIIAARKANWKQPELKAKSGLLYKYAKQVSNAANGCVTDDV